MLPQPWWPDWLFFGWWLGGGLWIASCVSLVAWAGWTMEEGRL